MPRKYVLKRPKQYTEDDLKLADSEIVSGKINFKNCAEKYKIPRATLILRVKGRKNRSAAGESTKVGRRTDLSPEVEKIIIDSINALNKWGFGLRRDEVKNLVEEYVTKNGIDTRFAKNRPGDDWWTGFKQRHNLTLRKPERMEGSRSRQASDPFIIMDFYDNLEKVMKKQGLLDKPQCVRNADESGFNHDPGTTKIVVSKGHVAKRQTGGSGRESTTILAYGNAAGRVLPPAILHEGQY